MAGRFSRDRRSGICKRSAFCAIKLKELTTILTMKLRPRTYFILSGVFFAVFVLSFVLKFEVMRWAFMGAAIGSLIRGFYEESKESKAIKNNNQ